LVAREISAPSSYVTLILKQHLMNKMVSLKLILNITVTLLVFLSACSREDSKSPPTMVPGLTENIVPIDTNDAPKIEHNAGSVDRIPTEPSQRETHDWSQVAKDESNGQFQLGLWLRVDKVPIGETIELKAKIKNLSSSEQQYTMWAVGDPDLYIRIVENQDKGTDEIYLFSNDDTTPLFDGITLGTMQPQQTFERTVVWDLHIPVDNVPTQVPTGTYIIEVDFFPGAQNKGPTGNVLRITYPIEIINGD